MNTIGIKAKIAGFVAALGLTLSLVAGVAAQTEVDGSVTLDGGTCAMNVVSGSFDFNDVTWNGTRWVHANQAGATIKVNFTPGWTPIGGTGKCQVAVSTTGLTNGQHTITSSYFRVAAVQLPQLFPMRALPGVFTLNAGQADFQMYIWEFLPRTFTPGDYAGTFTFTVSNGQ